MVILCFLEMEIKDEVRRLGGLRKRRQETQRDNWRKKTMLSMILEL